MAKVDIHPAAMARDIVMLHMLAELAEIQPMSARVSSPRGHDLLATMLFTL